MTTDELVEQLRLADRGGRATVLLSDGRAVRGVDLVIPTQADQELAALDGEPALSPQLVIR